MSKPRIISRKEYTALRRFYAWTGFAFWLVAVPVLVSLIIWAHVYLFQHGFFS